MKKKITRYVVLQCVECKSQDGSWKLSGFVRQLGKEYKRRGYVEQCCGCGKSPNTRHHIVGLIEECQISLTADAVFKRYEREVNAKRKKRAS